MLIVTAIVSPMKLKPCRAVREAICLGVITEVKDAEQRFGY
jgi:hypothetical protein